MGVTWSSHGLFTRCLRHLSLDDDCDQRQVERGKVTDSGLSMVPGQHDSRLKMGCGNRD